MNARVNKSVDVEKIKKEAVLEYRVQQTEERVDVISKDLKNFFEVDLPKMKRDFSNLVTRGTSMSILNIGVLVLYIIVSKVIQ